MLKDVSPYFVFDGNAAEAIEFYSNVFHTKILDVTYFRDMPADPDFPMTDDVKDLVLNGSIELPNGGTFMFSDNMPGMPFTIGNQITTAIIFDHVEDTRATYEKLSADGQIVMPLQETYWSPLYGNPTDKFGNQWQLDTLSENNEQN